MSPTYRAASLFKEAAREYGWEIVPCVDGADPWGARKGDQKIMIWESRRGGLLYVSMLHKAAVVVLDTRYSGKLQVALQYLSGTINWSAL